LQREQEDGGDMETSLHVLSVSTWSVGYSKVSFLFLKEQIKSIIIIMVIDSSAANELLREAWDQATNIRQRAAACTNGGQGRVLRSQVGGGVETNPRCACLVILHPVLPPPCLHRLESHTGAVFSKHATMTTPFTGLFIDASCNSRFSHG